MLRIILALVFALALSVAAGAQPAPAPHEVRHSGRIVELAPDGSAFVLEELVSWSGPGSRSTIAL